VPEYWIANISAGVIEVHTDPVAGRYTRVTPYRPGDSVHLRAFPDLDLSVADILRWAWPPLARPSSKILASVSRCGNLTPVPRIRAVARAVRADSS
jgi:hypothetical protein